jgi:RNA polymerase sigma-70 factor (ECF subfamily)
MVGGDAVERMYREGTRCWPLFSVSLDTFHEQCVRLLGEAPDPDVESHAAELYLCCACAGKDRLAMAAFESEWRVVARAAVARVHADSEFVNETVQEIWDQLLAGPAPKIARYSGQGPLGAWLRVVATRTALDRCRTRRRNTARHAELVENLMAEEASPELGMLRHQYAESLQDALRSAVLQLSPRDRNVLRLHVQERCNIDDIGRTYGVHRATAARWLERVRTRVFESAHGRLAGTRAMTTSEFRSVAWAVRSELELGPSLFSMGADAVDSA